jgi:hypothetical protein
MVRFCIYTLFLAWCVGGNVGSAQTNAPKADSGSKPTGKQPLAPTKTTSALLGDLTGKVFAITKGGDLKQARFAQVFVLSGDSATAFNTIMLSNAEVVSQFTKLRDEREANEVLSASPSAAYIQARIAQADSAMKALCNSILSTPHNKALDLAKAHPDQVVTSETDEAGFFKIGGPRPGAYTVLVVGRAGANDGFWVGNVALEAGKDSALKMRSPALACLNL